MARIDTLGNFLTDVAEAIRAKEGTTGIIPASEFDTRISNLSGTGGESGDGDDSTTGLVYVDNKYAQLSDTTDTTLTHYLNMEEDNYDINIIIIYGFARSEYTMPDIFNLLVEKTLPTVDGITQTLFVGYVTLEALNGTNSITITQTESARLALGHIPLCNAKPPVVVDDIPEGGNITGPISITSDNKLNIYLLSQVYGTSITGTGFSVKVPQSTVSVRRLGYFISTYAGEKTLDWAQNSYNDMIHITVSPLK